MRKIDLSRENGGGKKEKKHEKKKNMTKKDRKKRKEYKHKIRPMCQSGSGKEN